MSNTQEFFFNKWISELEDADFGINLEMHSLLGVFEAYPKTPDEIVDERALDPSQFNESVNACLTKSLDDSQASDFDWDLFRRDLSPKDREYYFQELETDDEGLDAALSFLGGSSVFFATTVKAPTNIQASKAYTEFDGPELSGRYVEINNAVAKKFFGTHQQDKPVYLNMEDSVVEEIARDLELPGDAFEAFDSAVRDNLYLTSKRSVIYERFDNAIADWKSSDKTEPPPHLGLLAFFCRAAQRMQSDKEYSGSNYYVRYYEGLTLANGSREANKAQNAFRLVAIPYFELLNDWLTSNNYALGEPTAVALDSRTHVGLPIVQSLMRDADRVKLSGMFLAYRLAPRSNWFPSDISSLLQQWLPSSNVSGLLKRLSNNPMVMEQIASVAAQELSSWDGSSNDPTQDTIPDNTIRLSATGLQYLNKKLHLGLLVPSALGLQGTVIEPDENAPEPIKRMVEEGMLEVDGFYGTESYAQIENTNRLDWGTTLEHPFDLVGDNGITVKWSPKECLVLRKDPDMPGRFVEEESLELNTELLLMVRQQYTKAVADHLSTVADPKFRHSTRDLPDCPAGWSVFTNVFVTKNIDPEGTGLESLNPPQTNFTKVDLEGGFRISPGNRRAVWHASSPPQALITVRNTIDAAVEVTFRPLSTNEESIILAKKTFEGNTVLEIPQQSTSGQLSIKLFEPSGSKRFQSRPVLLVNGDNPLPPLASGGNWILGHELDPHRNVHARRYEESPSLGHAVGARFFGDLKPNNVCKWPDVDWEREGMGNRPVTPGDDEVSAVGIQPQKTPWEEMQVLPGWTAEGHLYKIDASAEPHNANDSEACAKCGFPTYHSFSYWDSAGTRTQKDHGAPRFTPERSRIENWKPDDGDVLLDSLTYLQKGHWRDFRRLALNVYERLALEDDVVEERYFPFQLARDLDAMGHLELGFGQDGNPVAWAIAPTTLVVDSNRSSIFMAGSRSNQDIAWIQSLSTKFGGVVETSSQMDGRPSWIGITNLKEEEVQNIRAEIGEKLEDHVPELLLSLTENLSSLVNDLPVIERSRQQCVRFDPSTTENKPHEYVPGEIGAYRFGRWRKTWAFHDGKHLRQCDWRTAKHLSALKSRRLVDFEQKSHELRVPIGAELPGIFERVATLCSGYAPIQQWRQGSKYRVYRGVPELIASGIYHRLYGQKG